MPEKDKIKQSTKSGVQATTTTARKTVSDKNKVLTTKIEEAKSKEKILKTQALYNEMAVDTKGLSKVQKLTIATALGMTTLTAVAVPVTMHIIDINSPFEIGVTTNVNGQAKNQTLTIDPGTLIADLQPIEKVGYVFKGWYKDANCTIPYELSYEIQENDMVYALLVEEVQKFTTTFYYNDQAYELEIDDSMTIEDVQAKFLSQLGMTEHQFVTQEGKYYFGLYKDNTINQSKMYKPGYEMTPNDTEIYAHFGNKTYRVAFPRLEGVYIEDLEGNELTSKTVTHGGIIQFKVFAINGYVKSENFAVWVNGNPVLPNGETYSIPVTTHIGIFIDGIEQGKVVSVNIAGNITEMISNQDQTLADTLALNGLTEENTFGFYLDENYTEYVDIYNVSLDDNITLYTRMATLDKLTINNGRVSAKDENIAGEVVIPRIYNGNIVTTIGAPSFCENVTSVIIPNTINDMSGTSFYNWRNLSNIIVAGGNSRYYSVDNCVIEKATKTLVVGSKIGFIPSDGSVTKIGMQAFAGRDITEITIPNTITDMGTWAFQSCKLTSVTIPESVVSIGIQAFWEFRGSIIFEDEYRWFKNSVSAENMVDVSNPEKNVEYFHDRYPLIKSKELLEYNIVVTIGEWAGSTTTIKAKESSNLLELLEQNGLSEENTIGFYSDDEFENYVDVYNAAQISGDVYLYTIMATPEKLKVINGAVSAKDTLISGTVVIPRKYDGELITSIDSAAFDGCVGLTSIYIPDNITTIGAAAFLECVNLTSITIPESVESIQAYAFSGCAALESIVFEDEYRWFKDSVDFNNLIDVSNSETIAQQLIGTESGHDLIKSKDNI